MMKEEIPQSFTTNDRKVVIELENVRRNFQVGEEVFMLCGVCRSRYMRANL